MSVFKRKTSAGETQEYHYEFSQGKKRYRGVCEGCTTKAAALNYEKSIREQAKDVSKLGKKRAVIENYLQDLTGGSTIPLKKAFDLYVKKPRRKQPSAQQQAINWSQWNDFVSFMAEKYPDVVNLDMVSKQHAEEYISYISTNGRFVTMICSNRKKFSPGYYPAQRQLSQRTVNAYHKTIKSVFSKLMEDAGVLYNPFNFECMANDSRSREIFTESELTHIFENLDNFTKPIFYIGFCTGLSIGDICTLRWDEIKDHERIVRQRRKTGVALDIPIWEPLKPFLKEQEAKSGGKEYVLPDHAEMYQKNPSGISRRIKKFLESIGMQTTIRMKGHGRASSIRGIHSLRHNFAYFAGCNDVPLPLVQSIMGHKSPEMTQHYQEHANREEKQKYMQQMPVPAFLMHSPETVQKGPSEHKEMIKAITDRLGNLTDKQLEQLNSLIIGL